MLGELHRLGGDDGAQPVQGLAYAVYDPAEQVHAHRDAVILGDGHHTGTWNDPLELLARHQKQPIAGEAHHFGLQHAILGVDAAEGPDGGAAADGFQGQPHHPGEFARHRRYGREIADPVALQSTEQGCCHRASREKGERGRDREPAAIVTRPGDSTQPPGFPVHNRERVSVGIVTKEVAQQLIDAPREGQIDAGEFGGQLQIPRG
ncbi:hypothetical protein D3C84_872210 [compost metagenome]